MHLVITSEIKSWVFFLGVVLLAEKVCFSIRQAAPNFRYLGNRAKVQCHQVRSQGHLKASLDAGQCDSQLKGHLDIIFHINIKVSSL